MVTIGGNTILNFWHIENGRNEQHPHGGFAVLKDDFDMISYNFNLENVSYDLKNRIGKNLMPLAIFERMRVIPIAYREYWENADGDKWGFDSKQKGTLRSEFIVGLTGKDENEKDKFMAFAQIRFKGHSAAKFTEIVIKNIMTACDKGNSTPRNIICDFKIDKTRKFNDGDASKKGVTLIGIVKLERFQNESQDLVDEFYKNILASGWAKEFVQRNFREAKQM